MTWGRKIVRTRGQSRAVSSRHDKTSILKNAAVVAAYTRPTQDQASLYSSLEWERACEHKPYQGSHWQLMASWRVRVSFLKECDPEEDDHASVDTPQP